MSELNLAKFWRAKWWLAIWTVLGAAAGVGYAHFNEPTHEAAAKLLVEQAPAPFDDREPAWDRNFMPTQAEICSSPAVVSAAARRVWVDGDIDSPSLDSVIGNLNVSPLVGANVLSIRYRNGDSEIAAKLIDEIIVEYTAFLVENERVHRHEAVRALEAKSEELKNRESELIAARENQRRANPVAGISADAGRIPRELVGLRLAAVSEAQTRRIQIEQKLRSMRLLEESANQEQDDALISSTEPVSTFDSTGVSFEPVASSSVRMVRTPSLRMNEELHAACEELLRHQPQDDWLGLPNANSIFQELILAETQLAELATRVGERHREMISAKSRVEALHNQLDTIIASVPNILLRAWERSKEDERLARGAYEAELEQVASLDQAILLDSKLGEEISQIREEQKQVDVQLSSRKLVNQSESDRPMTITLRVLEEPALMPKPLVISSKVLGGLGAVFGLLTGLLMCVVGVSRETS